MAQSQDDKAWIKAWRAENPKVHCFAQEIFNSLPTERQLTELQHGYLIIHPEMHLTRADIERYEQRVRAGEVKPLSPMEAKLALSKQSKTTVSRGKTSLTRAEFKTLPVEKQQYILNNPNSYQITD